MIKSQYSDAYRPPPSSKPTKMSTIILNCWQFIYKNSSHFQDFEDNIFFTDPPPPQIFFFAHKKNIRYSLKPRVVFKSKFVSVQSKIFVYDSFLTMDFLWVKTHMGIRWFQVHFRAIFSSLWHRIKKLLHIGKYQLLCTKIHENERKGSLLVV